MKPLFPRFCAAAAPLLICLPLSLHGANFTLDLTNTALPSPYQTNWDTAPWRPASGAVPGSGDTITELKATGQTKYLGLNGNRTVDALTRANSNSITSIRISNGDATNSTANGGLQTLTISGKLAIHANTHFYSTSPGGGHMLALQAGSIAVEEATLYLGLNSARYVQSVKVDTTTTIAAGAFLTNLSRGFSTTAIDLGHMVNHGTFALASATALEDAAHEITLSVQSLSGGAGGSVTVESASGGTATLRIAGSNTQAAIYSGILENQSAPHLKVRKEGSGEQHFTRMEGNTYTGGTEIAGGILSVSNQTGSGLGSGPVTVGHQAALAVEGAMRLELGEGHTITFESGSLLMAGKAGAPATTTLSGASNGNAPLLDMESGASFAFRLEAGASDTIVFTDYTLGDLLLNANEVQFSGFSGPGRWTLFTFDADITQESWWDNGGLTFNAEAFPWFSPDDAFFVYDTHAIHLVVIPEPGAVGLALAGGLLALFFARKKIDL